MCCLLRRAQRPHGPTQQHQPRNSSVAAAWLRLMPALHHRRVAAVMSRDRSACAETMYNVWFRIGGARPGTGVAEHREDCRASNTPTDDRCLRTIAVVPKVRQVVVPCPTPPSFTLFHATITLNVWLVYRLSVVLAKDSKVTTRQHRAARAQGGCSRLRRSRHVGSACSCLLCRA